jgi:hypothetical protein
MNKIKQLIFTKDYHKNLEEDVNSGLISPYLTDEPFPFQENYPMGDSIITINPGFTLRLPLNNIENYDLENSIALYQEYFELNETTASDSRLWTYLTHVRFWDYMRKRWPAEKFEDDISENSENEAISNKQIDFIIWRYFLKTTNRRRLIRNGISRLWWYAHLTYDNKRSDPFELTRILLSYQDIAQSLLERSFGSNRNVLLTLLDYLNKNKTMSRENIREVIKDINLIGGVKNLQLIDKKDLI